jgi:hypothetical protein
MVDRATISGVSPEVWDLWYPRAAATGLPFARCRIEPASVVLVHAAPDALRIEVRDDNGRRLAFADGLRRAGPYIPMTRITRTSEATLLREDAWPAEEDLGRPVILPGGEAGRLQAWWNAEDGSEWRWSIEFYNRRS